MSSEVWTSERHADRPRPFPSFEQTRYSSAWAIPSGSGRREARIHTSCIVVSAPTLLTTTGYKPSRTGLRRVRGARATTAPKARKMTNPGHGPSTIHAANTTSAAAAHAATLRGNLFSARS
jgi:hypothetical protein